MKKEKKEGNPEEYTTFDKVLQRIGIAVAVLFLCFFTIQFTIHPMRINGTSMSPTYHDGQWVLTRSYFSREDIHYDDIIIFHLSKDSDDYYIKRVVGLPGDIITINRDGFFRNGEPVVDKFPKMGNGFQTVTLGEDEYFVLGDNRNNSNDSRVFGTIRFDLIKYIVR